MHFRSGGPCAVAAMALAIGAGGAAFAQCDGPTATWTLVTSDGPHGRENAGMAYDPYRGVTVMFGGRYFDDTDRYPTDTWEWTGSAWTHPTGAGPGSPIVASMAYDPVRRVTVLSGTTPASGGKAETWEWEGGAAKWTKRDAGGPNIRSVNTITYDAVRGRTMYIEGRKLWGWNGASWQEALDFGAAYMTQYVPEAQMVYDPANGRLNAFATLAVSSFTRRWPGLFTIEGSTLDLAQAGGIPVMRPLSVRTAFDSARGVLVLVGVPDSESYDNPLQTWEFDGVGWKQIDVAGPPGRSGVALAYDGGRGKVVLFGGASGDAKTFYSETWEYSVSGSSGPSFTDQPESQIVDDGKSFSLTVAVAGGAATYRWRRAGVDLSDGGAISGAATPVLAISPALVADSGDYDCVVNTPCGPITSCVAKVFVLCRADFNGDGKLNINDFIAFQAAFRKGCP